MHVLLMKGWWEQLMHLSNDFNEMGVVLSRVKNSSRAASGEPVNTSQTVGSICDREVNGTDHSSIIPIGSKGKGSIFTFNSLTKECMHAQLHTSRRTCLQTVCEPEEALVPALPETACVERGYIPLQQAYNLLNAEEGQPALHDAADDHALGMDPVILLGGFSAFNALYPLLCSPRMVLLEPERHTLTIYPSEILEGALYQGLAFLMEHRSWSPLHALRWLKERRACTAPDANFLRQLLTFEEQLFGSRLTSLDDIRR